MSSDAKASVQSDAGGSDAGTAAAAPHSASTVMRSYFDSLARAVSLDASAADRAWIITQMLESHYKTFAQDAVEVRKSWALRAAVGIFAACAETEEWNGIWFTQILRACEISATSFFTMVEDAKSVLNLPPAVSAGLQHAKGQFNVVVLLFKTFEKAKLQPAKLKSFGWTLFILARAELTDPLDLLTNVNLLIALLRLLRNNVNRLNTPVDASFGASSSPSTEASLIEEVGLAGKVSEADLDAVSQQSLFPWLEAALQKETLHGEIITSSGIEDSKIGTGPSFISASYLAMNTAKLFSAYQTASLQSLVSLDERFLLGNDASVINTPSKFATYGTRRYAGYVGRQLFPDAAADPAVVLGTQEPADAKLSSPLPVLPTRQPPATIPPAPVSHGHATGPSASSSAGVAPLARPQSSVPTPAPFRDLFRSPPPSSLAHLPTQTPMSASVECVRWLVDNFSELPHSFPEELEAVLTMCSPSPVDLISSTVSQFSARLEEAVTGVTAASSSLSTPSASPTGASTPRTARVSSRISLAATETVEEEAVPSTDGSKAGKSVTFSGVTSAFSYDAEAIDGRVTSVLTTSTPSLPKPPELLQLGTNVFYRTLVTMCQREAARNPAAELALLKNETFHKSLLGCAMEIVAFALNKTSVLFPRMAEIAELSAYDFGKSLEFVRKLDPPLPPALALHLMHVEDQILEEHAWKSGSAVFDAGSGGPSSGAPDSSHTVSAAVGAFLRKVAKLAAGRIEFLCDKLELTEAVSNEVWTAILHILECNLKVMRDQHLDRIILCTIYGVCKVNQLDRKFTVIIERYKELRPSGNVLRVIHNIALRDMSNIAMTADPPIVCGDIIFMYNKFFLPQMKEYILKFQKNPDGTHSASADRSLHVKKLPRTKALQSGGHAVRVTDKVTVSSRKTVSEASVLMTPGTRAMYAFGEPVPQEALAMINKAVNKRKADEFPAASGAVVEGWAPSMNLLIDAAMSELQTRGADVASSEGGDVEGEAEGDEGEDDDGTGETAQRKRARPSTE